MFKNQESRAKNQEPRVTVHYALLTGDDFAQPPITVDVPSTKYQEPSRDTGNENTNRRSRNRQTVHYSLSTAHSLLAGF